MNIREHLLPIAVLWTFIVLIHSGTVHSAIRPKDDPGSGIHRLHVFMNYGLITYLDGANLMMTAAMGMSPATDKRTMEIAQARMEEGRTDVTHALTGDQMQLFLDQGLEDHPLMKTAVDLGRTAQELMKVTDSMRMDRMAAEMMDLHHLHIVVNDGLKMVARGSNLMMISNVAPSVDIDQYMRNHGRKLMKGGRANIAEMADSPVMRKMHERGMTPDDHPMMGQTHRVIELSLKIYDILARMQIP